LLLQTRLTTSSERARSISPIKSSPANTPTTSRTPAAESGAPYQAASPTIDAERSSQVRRDMDLDDVKNRSSFSTPPTKKMPFDSVRDGGASLALKRVSPTRASPSSAMPSRSSTLSWQRRPDSQSSDHSSRPLSMVAVEKAAQSPRMTVTPELSMPSSTEQSLSREQIAQSLASKDPSWFRQTADRGLTSSAYRRNQVEDENRSDHSSNSTRVQMPGMSREGNGPDTLLSDSVDRSNSTSRSTVTYGGGSRSPHTISTGLGSPVPRTVEQKFDPPSVESKFETRGLAMSPSQGRISPERLDRPTSPTKGMGGFVQSAMMKRSDSVNKRWSVQSPPGLSRGNSVASNRKSHDLSTPLALGNIVNSSVSRPSSLSRENSPRPSSRPTSSQSNITITKEVQRSGTSIAMKSSANLPMSNDGFVKPSLPVLESVPFSDGRHERGVGNIYPANEATPPSSPSKTIDTRRWSPTKSSWLESVLNKPDSPKPKAAPPPQPAWMSEISKTKQRGSVDLTRTSIVNPKHEVNIGGLMRSPPLGGLAKPISIGGLSASFSSGANLKGRSESISSQASKKSLSGAEGSGVTSPAPIQMNKISPTNGIAKLSTPPKDFRVNLKPRQPAADDGKDEPEFKNVFGQLRRAKTQNYVAPDELKDNISRGKAALNITGGPKKTERKDEFKDAILKKKEDFRKAQQEGKGVARSAGGGNQESALPEALAKRKALGKLDSTEIEASIKATSNPALPTKENSAPGRLQKKEPIGGKLVGRLNPALADLLTRGPPSAASDTSRPVDNAYSHGTTSTSTSTTHQETPETVPQLIHMTKRRARGPRRKVPSTTSTVMAPEGKSTTESHSLSPVMPDVSGLINTPNSTGSTLNTSFQADGEDLASKSTSAQKLDLERRSQFLQEAPNANNKGEPLLHPPKHLSLSKQAIAPITHAKVSDNKLEAKSGLAARNKPSTPVKSPSLSSKTNVRSSSSEQEELFETRKLLPRSGPPDTSDSVELQPTCAVALQPRSSEFRVEGSRSGSAKEGHESSGSVKNVAASWDRSSSSHQIIARPRTRSPIRLPTVDDEKAAMVGAGLIPSSPTKVKPAIGLGLQIATDSRSVRPLPTLPPKGLLSPTHIAGLIPPASPLKSNLSPGPQTSEASRLLSEFFGQYSIPDSRPDFHADTASILSARPNQDTETKTLRSIVYQFSVDGKKQLVPTHQERLLFEANMYICIHAFVDKASKKVTEIYFWVGDEVPSSKVAAADIFAQREAQSAGGKLVKIAQGKETPEFFQALGGIIIIRRGSSNKYDSLAPCLLCIRKSFGQIAFDEVDYAPSSLCSGFPYLILTQSGKSYLWKGKGSSIDELSCARLIGMDFGLTGEIEEVEDGNEPASFLQTFGSGTAIPKSADHWRMKPNYNKYCGRLFCANSVEPQVSRCQAQRSCKVC
jgi:hypothetical protein